MKVLKRNQIIISVLALMLITVGYMSYTSNIHNTIETGALMDTETMAGIGDAKLVNSNNTVENSENSESNDNSESISGIVPNTADNDENETMVETTSATSYDANYFVASKLERDKMYSQMLETYQSIAESQSIPAEQKNASTQEITNINNKKNSIMIAENLIKNLGFDDVVIFVNDNSTSVIIKAENLSDADIAQIQNIICREIGVSVEEIHISLK